MLKHTSLIALAVAGLASGSIFNATAASKSACTGEDGHHICMVYNYSERKIWASYNKVPYAEKSKEQRAAQFPRTIPADNGAKYSVTKPSGDFKPFSVTYQGNRGGCKFTFSPENGSHKAMPNGYVITSQGVGEYTNDSCQHDGASLIINEH